VTRTTKETETMTTNQTTYYCVTTADRAVGPEVLPMRISNSGNLVDAGGHGRWPAGAHSLGRDRSRWPTLHATRDSAAGELAALAATCRHEWRHNDDERVCSRCGCAEPQYAAEDVAEGGAA
jgi:hypothetical protein